MEESIKQLIEIAKQNNNPELVQKLTEALELAKSNQNTQEDIKLKSQENINQEVNINQEEKKEEVIEQTKEEEKQDKLKEEDIQKMAIGEVSKLIITKTNNHILESKYMDMKPNTKNSDLRIDLENILVTLALDDVAKKKNATGKLYKLLDAYQKPEDVNDIQIFLNDIAKIGNVGLEAKESITNNSDNNHKKEVFNRYFDEEYEKKKKNADFLDMELDELHSKPNKNPNDYEEIIDRYNSLIQRLEELYDETINKVSIEKTQKLEETIKQLKNKVADIKKYTTALNEAINETNKLFDL